MNPNEKIIQGFDPKPAFKQWVKSDYHGRPEQYQSTHLEGLRLKIEKRGTDAVLTMGGNSILLERFDNVCAELCSWMRDK